MSFVLGIDIGGTGVKAALVDEEGQLHEQLTLSSEGQRDSVLRSLRMIVTELGEKAEAIGIGTAGSVDVEKKRITEISGNIEGWAGTEVCDILSQWTDRPMMLENDGNVALLAEVTYGAAKGAKSALMLTLGTGLGGAFFSRGELLHGAHTKGTEFGHMILHPGGRPCFCGQRGCYERYISGTALQENYREETGQLLSGVEIMQISYRDVAARQSMRRFMHDLALALASLKNAFDPEVIVLGGGVVKSAPMWWDECMALVAETVNCPQELDIRPAAFQNDAGILGAAALARRLVES